MSCFERSALATDSGDVVPEGSSSPSAVTDGDRDEVGIRQRRQLDDPNPVGKSRQQVSRNLDAEARLADAARADQGDEAVGGGKAKISSSSTSRPISSETASGRFVRRQDRAASRRPAAQVDRADSPVNW